MDSYICRELESVQRTNGVPTQIDLPPTAAEARGCGPGVMITVPVLAPRRELKWAEPPNVLTGIDTLREPRLQMQKTIHEGLHVETVDEPNGPHPEKTWPTEKKVTKED